jgi:hypothetical protein
MYLCKDGWACCACCMENGEHLTFAMPAEALDHLYQHAKRGDKVPTEAIIEVMDDVKAIDVAIKNGLFP